MHSVTTAISTIGRILRHRDLPVTLLAILLGCLCSAGPVRAADPAVAAVSPQTLHDLQQRAEQGDAQACFDLAGHYINGEGLPQSDTEALRWFGRAAAQGLATAQYNVGVMYATGRGVDKSLEQAARWYRVAAEQGHAEAQFNLGTQYAFGIGVERNLDEAVVWLDRAAEQNMAQAQYNLAVLLEQRNGAVNPRIASLYIQAAAQDYPPAQERLADLRALHILPMPQAEPPPPSAPTPPVTGAVPESVVAAAGANTNAAAPVSAARPVTGDSPARQATPERDENYRWLMARDPEHVTLHLGSFATAARAQAFVQRHRLSDQAYILAMEKDGEIWHGVFYGVFTGLTPGRAARAVLPAAVRSARPWLRNLADVQALEPLSVQRLVAARNPPAAQALARTVAHAPDRAGSGAAATQAVVDQTLSPDTIPADGLATVRAEDAAGNLQWFLGLAPDNVTLHVGSLRSKAEARAFIARHALDDRTFYFAIPKGDDIWYSVFYGVYPTMTLGRGAMVGLPRAVRDSQPWLRNIGDIQSALRDLDAAQQAIRGAAAGDS